ncbi:peptidylprolyl isomerase [Hoeflea poritis]|uniref:Parvulin-like PPIase n=1 Tax=Hoeflea poritis TaxID=2993659 RepID=A0ABT4VIB6_9HYPH|nr:peptidylprolyl isomerase [Hoeflea poritis]MDA4844459.1 peptidylprolyl isomerase [Hoeflea poritis]
MAIVYRNPSIEPAAVAPRPDGEGYTSYQEPDTSIPPKAGPVTREISVNGVAIAETELLAEAQNHPAENPGGALAEAARALVVRELLWQEARRLGIAVEPDRDKDGRPETERDAAIRLLIDREVDVPSAGEAECRRFYEQNPDRFSSQPIVEARHILLAAAPEDGAARKAASALAQRLCDHLADRRQDFADLAREHSACPSREQGGNLGQLTRGSTVPEFERAIERMKPGAISPVPVESRFGYHIIALGRREPGELLPFELVRERIATWLEAAAWSKAVSQYIAILAGKADIKGVSLKAGEGPLVQ